MGAKGGVNEWAAQVRCPLRRKVEAVQSYGVCCGKRGEDGGRRFAEQATYEVLPEQSKPSFKLTGPSLHGLGSLNV